MATSADRAAVYALDRAASGLDRVGLLEALFAESTVALSGPAGARTGFAMRRRFGRGGLIGPVVAGDPAEAAALMESLLQPGFVRIDVPGGSGVAAALGAVGLSLVDDVSVMVRGEWPDRAGGARLFGLGSQASG